MNGHRIYPLVVRPLLAGGTSGENSGDGADGAVSTESTQGQFADRRGWMVVGAHFRSARSQIARHQLRVAGNRHGRKVPQIQRGDSLGLDSDGRGDYNRVDQSHP